MKQTKKENHAEVTSNIGTDNKAANKYMILCGLPVPYMLKNDKIFIGVEKTFKLLQISEHVRKNGWKFIDACLIKSGLTASLSFDAITKRQKRNIISCDALLVLLDTFMSGNPARKKAMKESLISELQRHAASHVNTKSVIEDDQCNISSEKNNLFDLFAGTFSDCTSQPANTVKKDNSSIKNIVQR